MSVELETLVGQMKALTDLVTEHRNDPATLDWDQIKDTFGTQIEAMVAIQVAEKIAAMPVRPGSPIYAQNVDDIINLSDNRYAKTVRDISRDGYSSWGPQKVKTLDLWLAYRVLDAQWRIKQAGGYMDGQDGMQPPSDDLKAALKALTSTGTGTGDELVPTGMADRLWEDFFLASRVVSNLTVIDQPTDPYDVPLGLGDVTWRKGTEVTPTTSSDPATAKSILTTTEEVTEQNWSYTMTEDAIIAMAPELRKRLGLSGAENIDAFALNADSTDADTGNINLDDANPPNDSYYLSGGQDGIRHQWLVDNATQTLNAGGDALTDTDILNMLVKMGKYAVNPERCLMITDVSTYLKSFLGLDAVLTIDKFGPKAVVLTGQLAAYRGIPIIISASHPACEADGKVSTTAGNNTLGSISCLNRLMWYVGFRRRILIEVDRDIQRRMYLMVTSFRESVGAHGTRSTNTHTAGIRNILVS